MDGCTESSLETIMPLDEWVPDDGLNAPHILFDWLSPISQGIEGFVRYSQNLQFSSGAAPLSTDGATNTEARILVEFW